MGWQWQLHDFDGVFGLSQLFPDICQGCQREMPKVKGWEEEEDGGAGGRTSMEEKCMAKVMEGLWEQPGEEGCSWLQCLGCASHARAAELSV